MTFIPVDLPNPQEGESAAAPDWRAAAAAMEGRTLSHSEKTLPGVIFCLANRLVSAEGVEGLGRVASDHAGGIAVICIEGFLAPGSYAALRASLATALAAREVRGIALLIDSDGGDTSGALDAAQAIYSARKVKPIWSIISYRACGTACLLATAASVTILGRNGTMGSVGALQLRIDLSRAYATMGVTVTPITFGKRKADGLPFQPMSKQERASAQHDVDAIGTMFVNAVARYRAMRPEKVLAQRAATFMDDKAVRAGLADRISGGFPTDELAVFGRFLARLRGGSPHDALTARRQGPDQRLPPRAAVARPFVFRGIGRG